MTTKYIVSMSTGAFVAEIVTLPICTIKTNYQNALHKVTIAQVTTNLWTNYGYRGFYNSTTIALSSQIFAVTSRYVLYRHINTKVDNLMLSGLCSGILTSLVTHPLDVLKVHMQMNTTFITEYKKIGAKILYRGYSKTFSKYATGSMCFLPIRDILIKHNIDNTYASLISAVTSTIITQPFDYLKVRQTYGIYSNTYSLWFKGLSLNLCRVVPHFTIMMGVSDYVEKTFF